MKNKNIKIKVRFHDTETSKEKVSINYFIKVNKIVKVKKKN